jgi:hypothetical protein
MLCRNLMEDNLGQNCEYAWTSSQWHKMYFGPLMFVGFETLGFNCYEQSITSPALQS